MALGAAQHSTERHQVATVSKLNVVQSTCIVAMSHHHTHASACSSMDLDAFPFSPAVGVVFQQTDSVNNESLTQNK